MSRPELNSDRAKQRILTEIKRTAEENGGVPLGKRKFSQETGIKDSDWQGKLWARWSDAVVEAGLQPNQLQTAYDSEALIERFIELARELGHFPVAPEIVMKARSDKTFPWNKTFNRFGSKHQFAVKILDYCTNRVGYDDMTAMCECIVATKLDDIPATQDTDSADGTKEGYVYLGLLKLGREMRYKIGKAVLVERRRDQIAIQLPEDLELVHAITTDDAYGIESYWHRRFATRNTRGEWFSLSRKDVEAFKRRKFM